MLWYKSWLETRTRFAIGLALLLLSAAGAVLSYPQVVKLLPLVPATDLSGEIGRRIKEAADLSRDYRGYVWSNWIRQSLTQLGTLFAVLLGSGGVPGSGGAPLYTLSLPVSRNRLLGVRAATGLAEWLVLSLIPILLLPVLSPAIGERYGIGDALVHGAAFFVAGAVFFSLALLLSTVFGDLWRPLLITCAIAVVLSLCEAVLRNLSAYSIFTVMNGESYFRSGRLPWLGLFASAAASAAMLYGAALSIARRDF